MILELIHTSVRRGLRPGSRGFTTVAHTRGMAASVVEFVEGLSAYRFEFSPTGSDANLNPIARSHVLATIGGQQYHIVSRIAPSGADYSGRANRIAHHLVLGQSDCPDAGPAWLLAQQEIFQSEWNDEPQLLESRASLPDEKVFGSACDLWKELAGDAGWAGEIIRVSRAEPNREVYVVCKPGSDTLRLLAELAALLSPQDRWAFTFSSALSGVIPPGVKCQVRCVLDTPPGRRLLMGNRHALIVDLTKPLGPAPESEEANSSRQGLTISPSKTSVSMDQPLGKQRFVTASDQSSAGEVGIEPEAEPRSPVRPSQAISSAPQARVRSRTATARPARVENRKPPSIALFVIVGIVCLMLGGFLGRFVWRTGETQNDTQQLAQQEPAAAADGAAATSFDDVQDGPIQVAEEDPELDRLREENDRLNDQHDEDETEVLELQQQIVTLAQQIKALEQKSDPTPSELDFTMPPGEADPSSSQSDVVLDSSAQDVVKWLRVKHKEDCPSMILDLRDFNRLSKGWLQPYGLVLLWSDPHEEAGVTPEDELIWEDLRISARLVGEEIELTLAGGDLPEPGQGGPHIRGHDGQVGYLQQVRDPEIPTTALEWSKHGDPTLVCQMGKADSLSHQEYRQICGWGKSAFNKEIDGRTLTRGSLNIEIVQNTITLRIGSDLPREHFEQSVISIEKQIDELSLKVTQAKELRWPQKDRDLFFDELRQLRTLTTSLQDHPITIKAAKQHLAEEFEKKNGELVIYQDDGKALFVLRWDAWEKTLQDLAESKQ